MDFNPFLSIYNSRFSDKIERNWLLSSNSNIPILIYLQPDIVCLSYDIIIIYYTRLPYIIKVWNIKD